MGKKEVQNGVKGGAQNLLFTWLQHLVVLVVYFFCLSVTLTTTCVGRVFSSTSVFLKT